MAHYYTPDGTLVAYVPTADGKSTRPTNKRDARKLGLSPSVTTVLGLLAKPQLIDWQVKQAAEAGIRYGTKFLQPCEPWMVDEVVKESQQYSTAAADWGTEFHSAVSHMLQDRSWLGRIEVAETAEAFLNWLQAQSFTLIASERSFVSYLGYAGTLDLLAELNGRRVLADIKTQDFTDTAKARFYDEYALQLAAYALGIEEPEIARLSLVVSRSVPGLVAVKHWEDNAGDCRKWLAVWECWKELNEWEVASSSGQTVTSTGAPSGNLMAAGTQPG